MLLPVNTAMLAVLAAQLGQAQTTTLHWLFAIGASVPCLLSFAWAVRSAMPLLPPTGNSLTYYSDIAGHPPERFRDRVKALTEDEHLDDLAAQVHSSASIARDKMHHARNAYRALFAALPFWIAALYLLNTRS